VLRSAGSGAPILAVHATGFCKETWLPTLSDPALGEREWVAVDQRGHGDSFPPGQPCDWWEMGRDVLAVVAAYGWSAPVGLGHSSGAAVCLMAEILRPGTFSSLVLIEPIVPPPPYGRFDGHPLAVGARRRRSWFESPVATRAAFADRSPFDRWSGEALDLYVEHGFRDADGGRALKCEPETEADFYETAYVHMAWDRLGEVTIPTVIVAGEQSPTHPPSFVESQAARIPDARIEYVPGTAHFVPMEAPAAVAAIVAAMS